MSFSRAQLAFTDGQMKQLKKAIDTNTPVNIKLSAAQLKREGNVPFMVTKTQMNRLNKSASGNKGMILKVSKRQMNANKRDGGILPFLIPALAALATGALGAVGAFGATKALEGIETAVKGKGLRPLGTGLRPLGTGGRVQGPVIPVGAGNGLCSMCQGSGLAPIGTGAQKKRSVRQSRSKAAGLFPLGVAPIQRRR